MMISTKGRYALQVMLDLAQQCPDAYISLHDISQRQAVSMKYLEAIVKSLVSAGLVIGTRGKGGGYRLAQTPDQCTVAAILRAAEGSLSPVNCLDDDCPRHGNCATLPMWRELNRIIDDYFQGISLEQLTAQAQALGDTGVV